MKKIAAFLNNESGATVIEYGLIATGISVAILLGITTLGSQLNATFTTMKNGLNSVSK